jgi:hypothetical protein
MAFIPIIMVAATVASAAIAGASAAQQAATAKTTAEFNRRLAVSQATTELAVAGLEESKIRREGREAVANQFAGFAQSGLGVGDFTTQAALKASATAAEMDALTVRYKGQLAATQQRQAAGFYEYEAKVAENKEKLAQISTGLSMGTSLLSGYSRMQGVKI